MIKKLMNEPEPNLIDPSAAPQPVVLRFLSKAEVVERTNLSFPTIWKMMIEHRFPQARCVDDNHFAKPLWFEHEIEEWMEQRPLKTYRIPGA